MGNAEHKLIYERVDLVQNLFTTPLDVTGLDGDKFDYFIEWEVQLGSAGASIIVAFNGDESSNYRKYYMRSQATSAVASASDSTVPLYDNPNGGIARILLTGSMGSERYSSSLVSSDVTSIFVNSIYWKNTADNLTSLLIRSNVSAVDTLTIRIYQIPKQSNLDNYDLVESVDFVSSSSDIVFSGLDGDSDGEYLLDIQYESSSSGSFDMYFNADTGGTSYDGQYLANNNGSLISSSSNRGEMDFLFGIQVNPTNCLVAINATSGRKRLTTISLGGVNTSSFRQFEHAWWWDNDLDNLTNITFSNVVSATGSIKLYKRKSNKTIDPVPYEVVVDYPVSGDFSLGITISGMELDRIKGAVKIECFDFEGNSNITIQANSITSNSNQQLKGSSSSVSAGATSPTKPIICKGSVNVNGSTTWIYPKSGQNRPCLNEQSYNENTVEKNAIWINNDLDELTDFLIQAATTTSVTGRILISIPKGSKQASPSFIVTEN